jgi:RNA polymerase sigma factor (sigma-70 family)
VIPELLNTRTHHLSKTEEAGLFARCRKGCRRSRDTIVKHNLNIVASAAGRHAPRSSHLFAEFFQEGLVGLSHAIDKFDPAYGSRFSRYALRTVRRQILRHRIRFNRVMHYPGVWSTNLGAVYRYRDGKSTGHVSEAWAKTLSERLAVKESSFDTDGFEGGSMEDVVSSGAEINWLSPDTAALAGSTKDALAKLTDRERYIIERVVMHDDSMELVGRKLLLSRERVRQLKEIALEKLRCSAELARFDPEELELV